MEKLASRAGGVEASRGGEFSTVKYCLSLLVDQYKDDAILRFRDFVSAKNDMCTGWKHRR